MLQMLRRAVRQRQTLASFDYQWRHLPAGDAMLSDPWFDEHVTGLVPAITGIAPAWFRGRRVLDAGCGGGRWTVGLLRLGAEVTAVDFSAAGLASTRAAGQAFGRLETLRADLLHLPEELRGRRFDLVFSFGVLHHTGDTWAALRNVAGLVAEDGLLFLYLYGKGSWSLRQKLRTNWIRLRLAGLPFDRKVEALRRYDPDRDPHQSFDLLSPTINDRLSFETVRRELERLGFAGVTRTVRSGEIYLRAQRPGFREAAALAAGPTPASPLNARYDELQRRRRERGAERRAWDIAAPLIHRGLAPRRLPPLLERGGLAGRRVLVFCPDSLEPAREAARAGAEVTCLAPSESWAEAAQSAVAVEDSGILRLLVASPLDEPEEGGERFDLAVALGSALALTRNLELALHHLTGRLKPGGELLIETLLPEPETWRHRLRRLALRPLPFEKQIALLLGRHPELGLEGAYAAWSARWPPRPSPEKLREHLAGCGCEVLAEAQEGGRIAVLARRGAR